MAGTFRIGGKVLATHDSGTDEISLDSATNTSNMSFDANHAGIKTALNASGDAPIYACRAWVNFDGTTNTAGFCTIRDSGNVTSITDNGTGTYTINFTTEISDANYTVSGVTGYSDGGSAGSFNGGAVNIRWDTATPMQTGSLAIQTCSTNGLYDMKYVNVSIFR